MQHLRKERVTLPQALELILRAQLPVGPLKGSLGAGTGTRRQFVIHDSSLKRTQHFLEQIRARTSELTAAGKYQRLESKSCVIAL